MGKLSRRKAALRASAAERRLARELVAEVEAKGRAILGPEYEARARRRAKEIAEEEWLHPRSLKDPEVAQARRLGLLYQNLDRARQAFLAGVKLGQSRPVVLICDLRDKLARRIGATIQPDRIAPMLAQAERDDTIPIAIFTMSRTEALAALRSSSPGTCASLEEPEPHHTLFPAVVVAERGTRMALMNLEG